MTLTAVDLFAGAGGATQGLRDVGYDVVVAVENDPDASATWSQNHPGRMIQKDIRLVSGSDIMSAGGFSFGELDLLKACPPCQGFSSLRGSNSPDEDRNDLVLDTIRLIRELSPRAVLIENVPGLQRDGRFLTLTDELRQMNYLLTPYIVNATDLGVPQRRRRLVVVAIRDAIEAPPVWDELVPLDSRRASMSAGEALEKLALDAAEDDEWHIWREPKAKVLERIMSIPVGGSRFDLPVELQLECHKRMVTKDGLVRRSAGGSYGRVKAGSPAPTMTTRCTTPACGSFIHPSENRGISLREAAAFQTFPSDYKWVGNYGSVERQIGNAVPVWMAEALGAAVKSILESLLAPTR